MPEWLNWWSVGGGSVAARLIWAALRRTHPLKPSIPFWDRVYAAGTSNTLLLLCRIEGRQLRRVILDLLDMLEMAGVSVDEMRAEYRKKSERASAGGTGSPFDSWLGGEHDSTKASPTTPPSSPPSDPTAPEKSSKNP